MYACVCAYVSFCEPWVCSTHRGQETDLYPCKLQWQLLLATSMGTGNWIWVFSMINRLNYWAISPDSTQ